MSGIARYLGPSAVTWGCLIPSKRPQRLVFIIIFLPVGLKGYVEEPSVAASHRPRVCPGCGHAGSWHLHGRRPRWVQIGRERVRLRVQRLRCPRCRATATALPEDVVPGLGHDLGTVAGIIAAYLDGDVSYRELPLRVLGIAPPPGNTANTTWTSPDAPSPTPTTCFRWITRFALGAHAWWLLAAADLQARGAYAPPPAPVLPVARAHAEAKHAALRLACQALDAYRRLADRFSIGVERWPFLLRHAPSAPAGLDRTAWFCRPPPPP